MLISIYSRLKYILGKKIKKILMVEPEKTMKDLPRRMRYYQGMLDIAFFPAGADYNQMRKSFVIFICNFDPYGEERYIYSFQNRCDQNSEILFGDDAIKVVVNTKGKKGDISPELKEVIIYLDREEVTGPYSRELDDAVNELKLNEERGQEYMLLMAYGAEREAAGKYMGKVEQIRGVADKADWR